MQQKQAIAHDGHNVSAETHLFQAVVARAMLDIVTFYLSKDKCRYKQEKKRRQCEETVKWLFEFSHDFQLVCSFAGYDPIYIQTKARKLIERLESNEIPKGKYYNAIDIKKKKKTGVRKSGRRTKQPVAYR